MQRLWEIIKHEPAIVIGLLGTIVLAIESGIADGSLRDWRDFIPLVLGILTRFFVSPAFTQKSETVAQPEQQELFQKLPPPNAT